MHKGTISSLVHIFIVWKYLVIAVYFLRFSVDGMISYDV